MARRFTLQLENQTKYVLARDAISTARGEWEREPPPSLAPGEVGRWTSISPDMFLIGTWWGTEAAVRYKIHDGAMRRPPAADGCVTLGWKNPFLGSPTAAARFDECGRDVSPDFRLSNDFEWQQYGDDWLEDMARPFGLLGFAGTDHAILYWRLTETSAATLSDGLNVEALPEAPPVGTYFTPVIDPTAGDWGGRWGDRHVNPTRIVVSIDVVGPAFDITTDERAVASFVTAGARTTPLALPAYRGDRWPLAPVDLISERTSVIADSIRHIGILAAGAIIGIFRKPRLPLAMPLQQGVVLQLWEERTRGSKAVIRRRLRYLRRSRTGKTETDVMLVATSVIK